MAGTCEMGAPLDGRKPCKRCGAEATEVCRDWVRWADKELPIRRARIEALEEALRLWQGYGCPVCGGDCASANPPVSGCPVRATYEALGDE